MSFVVTIDGPAAAGKSTTAREVARRLGFRYVDTGALYRALAWKLLDEGGSPDDVATVDALLARTTLDLIGEPERPHVLLDGVDVTAHIRTPAVGEMASRLAALPEVRRGLRDVQRSLREHGPLVGEGRDLGTVVFPDAEVKIYLDADVATRTRRRTRELESRGIPMRPEDVRDELERRDARDRERAEAPLQAPEGAVVVDSSGLDAEGVVEAVLQVVRSHPACPAAGPAR